VGPRISIDTETKKEYDFIALSGYTDLVKTVSSLESVQLPQQFLLCIPSTSYETLVPSLISLYLLLRFMYISQYDAGIDKFLLVSSSQF